MYKNKKSAMTSVTFRSLSVDDIISLVKESGLDGIEWGGDVHVPVGDYRLARCVGEKTRAEGLEVISYGSYYTVGQQKDYLAVFEKVVETALALGTRTVRIWNYHKASSLCSDLEFKNAVTELKQICEYAAKKDVTVAMEFHSGSLNDNAMSCRKVLQAVNKVNLKTYWQPLYDIEKNLQEITELKNYILNVHVYKWIQNKDIERMPISSAKMEWENYITLIGKGTFIIEFVKDDSPQNFIGDAKTLKELLNIVDNRKNGNRKVKKQRL